MLDMTPRRPPGTVRSINKFQTVKKQAQHASSSSSYNPKSKTRQRLTSALFRFLFVVYAAFVCSSFWKSHKLWHGPGGSKSSRSSTKTDTSHKQSDLVMPQQQQHRVQTTAAVQPGTARAGAGAAGAEPLLSLSSPSPSITTTTGVLAFNETQQQLNMLNKVFCMGQFGLGHRLSKLAAAYHLACHVLELPRLQVHWGSCRTRNNSNSSQEHDDDDEIFANLFGSNRLQCPSPLVQKQQQEETEEEKARSLYQNKTIVIRNDVIGYYAGQAYKNAQVPIDMAALASTTTAITSARSSHYNHAWLSKLDLDTLLFQDLVHHFYSKNAQRIQAFQQEHDWNSIKGKRNHDDHRLVIGLHIRAGNGEQDHFQAARRGSLFDASNDRTTTFAIQLANLIHQLIHHYHHQEISSSASTTTIKHKAPLVFLATDTADYIPILQNAFANIASSTLLSPPIMVKVVTFPQERVPAKQGVSYQQWTQGQSCRDGWRDSFMDMALLAQSDIVVAATRSTFTQILPQALVWKKNEETNNKNNIEKPRLKFCQVGRRVLNHRNELIMSCFTNKRAWLFGPSMEGGTQGGQVKTFVSNLNQEEEEEDKSTMTIVDTVETTKRSMTSKSATDVGVVDRHGSVAHKILVHFPDVEQDSLTQRAKSFLRNPATVGEIFAYGRRIATKYRGKRNEEFRADWTSI